jgi:hypothetical protein
MEPLVMMHNNIEGGIFSKNKRAIQILHRLLNKELQFDQISSELNILVPLLGFPDFQFRKKIWKTLTTKKLIEFPEKIPQPYWKTLPESLKRESLGFTLALLTDKDPKIYLSILKEIDVYYSEFRPLLLELLIDPIEIFSESAIKLLFEHEPALFQEPRLKSILTKIPFEQQQSFINILLPRLESSDWHIRELTIRMLTGFHNSEVLISLQKMIYDPDPNVRWTLATSLADFKHPLVFEILHRLLLDDQFEVQQQARISLQQVLPGLYAEKSVTDILIALGREYPVQLLQICSNKPRNDSITRIWRNLGYNTDFLYAYVQLSAPQLLNRLMETPDIRDIPTENARNLLIYYHVPKITDVIDNELQSQTDPRKRSLLETFSSLIHQKFRIEQPNGFEFLL